MNTDFLKKMGISEENPNDVLNKLGSKEVELLDKRDLAETNGETERVQEIDTLLGQLRAEREIVKEEAKSYVPPKEEQHSAKESAKAQSEKKKELYEKLMQKKQAEAQAAQQAVLQSAAASGATPAAGNTNTASQQAPLQSKISGNAAQSKATQQKSAQQAAQPQQNMPTASGMGDYSAGLRYYQKQDYANAFKCFMKVAEAKKAEDANAAKERTMASYLLAVMYRDGTGTNKDPDRSSHYLKRAADFGYDQAQLEYGILVLSQHTSNSTENLKARKIGMKYVEQAASAGLLDAVKKYAELVKNSSDADKKMIEKAKQYINKIKGQQDSYGQQKCEEWLKEISDTEKARKKKTSYPKKYIIGDILFVLGTIYLFKGLNPTYFAESHPEINKIFFDIPDVLILKWKQLTDILDPYMTHQGIFGGWIIILGNFIRGLGVGYIKNHPTTCKGCVFFGKVVTLAVALLCIWHFRVNVEETMHLLGNGGYMQIIVMAGSIVIGRGLGQIGFKIIK